MLRVLLDHNFDQDILRGLLRRLPALDVTIAYEAGLSRTADPDLLIWAAKEGLLLLTHDRNTIPAYAKAVIGAGHTIAGAVIVPVPGQMPIAQIIEQLELIVTCTDKSEWQNVVDYLPLR